MINSKFRKFRKFRNFLSVSNFVAKHRPYIRSLRHKTASFGFDLRKMAQASTLLAFLYEEWWQVQVSGLEKLPAEGPALIVGNNSGLVPWPALMLMYALMSSKRKARRLYVIADMDWVKDQTVLSFAKALGFVPWSSENMKTLLNAGELVAIFPEGLSAANKPFSERYRVRDFDWTRLLPAIEFGAQIFSMATIGCDEAVPNVLEPENLRKWLGLAALPITPFFPWLPFPLNLGSFPVRWYIGIKKHMTYASPSDRSETEQLAKSQTKFVQGEIQAELNRLLRGRIKSYI